MDPAAALDDLLEVSSQIESAVLVGADGSVTGSTFPDEQRASRLADLAKRLFDAAEEGERGGPAPRPLSQLEAATLEGSVFVVRDGERLIAAATGPEPTVGLVFYDLKTCLRQTGKDEGEPAQEATATQAEAPAEPEQAPEKPRRTRKKADATP
jgi:predicted regulator of Ras-like GTPase activity (Roadblock/LC7/MglB family)